MHVNITNSDLDTDKPLPQQFDSILGYQRTHLSAVQYRNFRVSEGL
ncbi:MAG: hypothetical protein ACJ71K_07645 [Nitrososphaeraceae archaeon]|jgi:hypothetical protein